MRIYVAGPLFTHAERLWNAALANELRCHGINVVLPQERAHEMLIGKVPFDPAAIFNGCTSGVDDCDLVLAILDGPDPDSGTCWECGYAWKCGKPIVGVRTDFRTGGDDGDRPVNLMLARCCADFVVADMRNTSVADLAKTISETLSRLSAAQAKPIE